MPIIINLILIVDDSSCMKDMRHKLGNRQHVSHKKKCGFRLHLLKISGTDVTLQIQYSPQNGCLNIRNSENDEENYSINCEDKTYIIVPHLGGPPTSGEEPRTTYISAYQFCGGNCCTNAPVLLNTYNGKWRQLRTENNACIRISSIRSNIWDVLYNNFMGNDCNLLSPFNE